MAASKRQQVVKAAAEKLEADGQLICVCGQVLLDAEEYVDHISGCAFQARADAARGESKKD